MTDELEIYRQALKIIISLPATRTGLGLEEAKRYAQRALDLAEHYGLIGENVE